MIQIEITALTNTMAAIAGDKPAEKTCADFLDVLRSLTGYSPARSASSGRKTLTAVASDDLIGNIATVSGFGIAGVPMPEQASVEQGLPSSLSGTPPTTDGIPLAALGMPPNTAQIPLATGETISFPLNAEEQVARLDAEISIPMHAPAAMEIVNRAESGLAGRAGIPLESEAQIWSSSRQSAAAPKDLSLNSVSRPITEQVADNVTEPVRAVLLAAIPGVAVTPTNEIPISGELPVIQRSADRGLEEADRDHNGSRSTGAAAPHPNDSPALPERSFGQMVSVRPDSRSETPATVTGTVTAEGSSVDAARLLGAPELYREAARTQPVPADQAQLPPALTGKIPEGSRTAPRENPPLPMGAEEPSEGMMTAGENALPLPGRSKGAKISGPASGKAREPTSLAKAGSASGISEDNTGKGKYQFRATGRVSPGSSANSLPLIASDRTLGASPGGGSIPESSGKSGEHLSQVSQIRPERNEGQLPAGMPTTTELFGQITNRVTLSVSGNRRELTVRLQPEQLGKLQLKLSLDNGVVTARFYVENRTVQEVLELRMPELKSHLNNQGIDCGKVEVFLQSDGSNGAPRQQLDRQGSQQTDSRSPNPNRVYADSTPARAASLPPGSGTTLNCMI